MGRPQVVVTQWAHAETLGFLSSFAEVVPNESREPLSLEELARRCRKAAAILVFMSDMVDDAFLARCTDLKIVAAALKGFDNFDVPACTRRGIWFTNVPDLLAVPTAELAVGLLIGLVRHIRSGDDLVRSGRFAGWRPQFYGLGLAGSRAGIVGFGRVGCALAERLRPFLVEVVYSDPQRLSPTEEARLGVTHLSFEELLATSHFVFPFVPLDKTTVHLIDERALALMMRSAVIVNCGRGSVVDEGAVLTALVSGRLAGYAADVFEMEDWARGERPRLVDPRLLSLTDRTLFTPHLGSAVGSVRLEIELFAARQIEKALRGERPDAAINDPEESRKDTAAIR